MFHNDEYVWFSNYWVDLENKYVKNKQDSIAQRNADYFVRDDDVYDPDKIINNK